MEKDNSLVNRLAKAASEDFKQGMADAEIDNPLKGDLPTFREVMSDIKNGISGLFNREKQENERIVNIDNPFAQEHPYGGGSLDNAKMYTTKDAFKNLNQFKK